MKVEEWIPIKEAIAEAIENCGYVKNENSGNWQRPRKNNVMISIVYLAMVPEDIKNIPVQFINSEDLDSDPSDTDHDTILARTAHIVRKAVQKYQEKQQEVVEAELIEEPAKEPVKKEKPTQKPKQQKKKNNVPAKVEKTQPPAKVDDWRKGRTDAELAKEIEAAEKEKKTKNFLKNRGSTYSVSGNERPDSPAIQNIANKAGVSLELILAEQNEKQCKVIVRGHLDGRYVDAVVIHDFEVEKQLMMMEMVHNRPDILDYYDGLTPVFIEGSTVRVKGKEGWEDVPVMYWIIHNILKQRGFAIRDARTKAGAIAEMGVMTGMDWRDQEEIDSENQERDMVQNSIETEKAMRQ